MDTVLNIVSDCGGKTAICEASKKAGKNISEDAVRKWRGSGIPERHWSTLIGLCPRLTVDILFNVNTLIRESEVV